MKKNAYFCEKLDSMAVELQQTVTRIAAKSRIILERYELMKRQLKADVEKIAQLERDLEEYPALALGVGEKLLNMMGLSDLTNLKKL